MAHTYLSKDNINTMAASSDKTENNKSISQNRFLLLDAFRGFTMISMVLYHTCFDYFVAFGRDTGFLGSLPAFFWQQSICISFILLSGMVWPLGKKHAIRRGIILILLGCAVTIVTVLFVPSQSIYYGILTFMGIATLFMIPIDRAYDLNQKSGKNNPVLTELIHIIIVLILFMLFKHLPNGYIGTRNHIFVRFPSSIYTLPALVPLGLPTSDFRSADYFPIIPWIFMYILGYHLGKILLDNETFKKLNTTGIPFLSWFGRKSLLVYIIHQPVCFGIVWLICR
jgi:uncharacterized membrane protein